MSAKYLLVFLLLSNSLFACDKANSAGNPQVINNIQYDNTQSNKMKITIGSKTFTATLDDNETAKDFKSDAALNLEDG